MRHMPTKRLPRYVASSILAHRAYTRGHFAGAEQGEAERLHLERQLAAATTPSVEELAGMEADYRSRTRGF